jgi:hypothetical protein
MHQIRLGGGGQPLVVASVIMRNRTLVTDTAAACASAAKHFKAEIEAANNGAQRQTTIVAGSRRSTDGARNLLYTRRRAVETSDNVDAVRRLSSTCSATTNLDTPPVNVTSLTTEVWLGRKTKPRPPNHVVTSNSRNGQARATNQTVIADVTMCRLDGIIKTFITYCCKRYN